MGNGRGSRILAEYDAKVIAECRAAAGSDTEGTAAGAAAADCSAGVSLSEANDKILAMVKKASDKALKQLLDNASEQMKIKYHRGDN